ncbi:MAG: 16S rRNA processing protein RimM [Candidatus Marinimicrobia bacterium]|nr:16S rRNA processing protein RimM [Candidatus Neomarinimicrobiota bacterium]
MERLIALAKITRATGLAGEVGLRPLTRYFSDYVEDHPLFLGFSSDLVREIELSNSVGVGAKVRCHFEGVNTRDDAEALIGQILFVNVPADDFINLSSDDLLGYDVITNTGEQIGELVDILMMPANDVYVINSGTKEILIPVIPEIVDGIDDIDGSIIITPMDGLLD